MNGRKDFFSAIILAVVKTPSQIFLIFLPLGLTLLSSVLASYCQYAIKLLTVRCSLSSIYYVLWTIQYILRMTSGRRRVSSVNKAEVGGKTFISGRVYCLAVCTADPL